MISRLSLLAISIAVVLTGCGSDDNDTAPVVDSTHTGSFVDSKVEGLYYQAQPSGLEGWTDTNGNYKAKTGDTVTFFLGGKTGLKIGATSTRGNDGVISPFESVGKYDRAVNLARILQTIDSDEANDDLIIIPDALTANISAEALTAVNTIQLDDMSTAQALFTELNLVNIVSENNAISHMENALEQAERGDHNTIDTFGIDTNKVIRNISVSQTVADQFSDTPTIYVHADKTLSPQEFEDTRGMEVMLFKFNSEGVLALPGTNDSTMSAPIPGTSTFKYKLLNKDDASEKEDLMPWDSVPDFGPIRCADSVGGCTPNKLNSMTDNIRNDGDSESPKWQREIESGFYDPVTGIHSVVRKKIACTDDTVSSCTGRTSTYLDYYYETPNSNSERYVDFTGTWEVVTSKPICNGLVARSIMTFSVDEFTVAGNDFGDGCNIEAMEMSGALTDLPGDYWWFNQANRPTKATLTELNSVVRWCDDDNYVEGESCKNDEFFNKWEYQPAGVNWDMGILTNRKMLPNGETRATHYMQKISK